MEVTQTIIQIMEVAQTIIQIKDVAQAVIQINELSPCICKTLHATAIERSYYPRKHVYQNSIYSPQKNYFHAIKSFSRECFHQ